MFDDLFNAERTEAGIMLCAERVALLVKERQDEAAKQDTIRQTFDRSKELDFVVADDCLDGISAVCGARLSTLLRTEETLFGRKKLRLLAVFGTAVQIELAQRLYAMIDDAIIHETENWRKSADARRLRNAALVTAASLFQATMAARLNTRLKAKGRPAERAVRPAAMVEEQRLGA